MSRINSGVYWLNSYWYGGLRVPPQSSSPAPDIKQQGNTVMSRETKSAILADAPAHTGAKIVAPNTVRYVASNGDTVWRLHHTDIVTHHVDGTWSLDSAGWKTVTTKERMNTFAPCTVSADRGIWYVGKGYGDTARIVYYDGIKLDADGNSIANGHDTAAVESDTRAIKRKIAKFVRLVDDCTDLPTPNAGDCWFCAMRDKDDSAGNTDHLMSHIDEGYLHGSLLINAMRARGYTDQSIGLHYQMNLRDAFKRALRRYLGRAMGLAIN